MALLHSPNPMAGYPQHTPTFARIVGFDSGSKRLGVGIIDFDILSKTIIQTQAFTIRAEHAQVSNTHAELFGARYGRIDAMQHALYSSLLHYKPNFAITETPFMGAHATAYGALTETVCAIRYACTAYDPHMTLFGVDPPSAKIAVGAAGNAGKPAMQAAVAALLPVLHYNEAACGNYYLLDEHSVDAIAVAKTLHGWIVNQSGPF